MQHRLELSRLLLLVREHEELYNNQHPEYSNHAQREAVWKNIGKIMNVSARDCKSKWHRIRENFRKAMILRRSKGAGSTCKKKPPRFYHEMNFIIPFLKEDEKASVLSNSDDGSNNEDDDKELTFQSFAKIKESPHSSDFLDVFENKDPVAVDNSGFINDECNSYEIPVTSTEPPDNLTEFFINMAKTVKTFPKKEQLLIKAQVFKIVNDVEFKLAS